MTDSIVTAVERYVSVWNQRNREDLEIAIREVFAADATYTDPLVDVKGHPGIGAVIAG
jgi:hypothetical protein